MVDYEQIINQLEERNEQRVTSSYYFLRKITQLGDGKCLKVEVSGLKNGPIIYAADSKKKMPQPVFVRYSHESDFAPYSFERNKINCFIIDIESKEPIEIIRCDDNGNPPCIKKGYKFFETFSTEDGEGEMVREIEPLSTVNSDCRFISLRANYK